MENSISIYVDNLPKGAIIMWFGKFENIPNGWKLCDGKNETPNLIGRFVVGAQQDYAEDESCNINSFYNGKTGGNSTVKLENKNIPPHSHQLYSNWAEAGGSYWKDLARFGGGREISAETDKTGGENGQAVPFEILPPFFAVFYIMKIV